MILFNKCFRFIILIWCYNLRQQIIYILVLHDARSKEADAVLQWNFSCYHQHGEKKNYGSARSYLKTSGKSAVKTFVVAVIITSELKAFFKVVMGDGIIYLVENETLYTWEELKGLQRTQFKVGNVWYKDKLWRSQQQLWISPNYQFLALASNEGPHSDGDKVGEVFTILKLTLFYYITRCHQHCLMW